MGHWNDVGKLASHSVSELETHAKRILRSEGLKGSLAKLYLREPGVGAWGDTRRELPQKVIESLAMQLESQSGFRLTEKGWTPAQTPGHPDILAALETGKVKFLVGALPDGTRMVGILLLK